MPSEKTKARDEEKLALTDADKRLIEFLVQQAIKQAVRSCT
jgi:hypothetical protein